MTSANLTRTETAARSAGITLLRTRLELDVTGAADPGVTGFPTASRLEFDATADETWVDFLGEDVSEALDIVKSQFRGQVIAARDLSSYPVSSVKESAHE